MFVRLAPRLAGRSNFLSTFQTTQYRYVRGKVTPKGSKITPTNEEESFFRLKQVKSPKEALQ